MPGVAGVRPPRVAGLLVGVARGLLVAALPGPGLETGGQQQDGEGEQ
jgi:hypothetical protein